jgi:hypothetical protein
MTNVMSANSSIPCLWPAGCICATSQWISPLNLHKISNIPIPISLDTWRKSQVKKRASFTMLGPWSRGKIRHRFYGVAIWPHLKTFGIFWLAIGKWKTLGK